MLILSWHPTYAFFRNPNEYGAFSVDLDRFARAIKGKLKPGPRKLVTEPTINDVKKLVAEGLPIAFDVETKPGKGLPDYTGKDPLRCRLHLIGLGNVNWGLSFRYGDDEALEDFVVKYVLENASIEKILMNGRWFDERVMIRYGVRLRNVFDIREARRAVSATSKLSLGYQASLYTDAPPWKEGDEDDDKGLVFTKNVRKKKRYNAMDCVQQARVAVGIRTEPEWSTPRVQKIYDVHRSLARIAAEMNTHGVMVHESNRQFMAWCLFKEKEEKTRKLRRLLDLPKKWKPTPRAMQSLLFKRYATSKTFSFNLQDPQDPKMWTEEGIKVDKNSLIKVIIDPMTPDLCRQAIELYWEAKRPGQWANTFLVGKKVSAAIGPDGRLRPGWNSAGTDTMRWSCSAPNMMNLPQLLRSMYRPAPGHVLIHADKSQLELRVMAVVAGDDVLQAALDSGDVYTEDAKAFFGLPDHFTKDDVKPDARKAAKIIHLAKQYAASDKTVHGQALRQDRNMKWSLTVALCRAFDQRYSATVAYWHREFAQVMRDGYSEGRILNNRRYYPRQPELSGVANFPVQDTAAELMNIELIALDRDLKKHVPSAKILIQLHDAVDVEAKEKDEKLVKEIMYDNLGTTEYVIDGRRLRTPVEIKTARVDWSEV